MTHGDCASAGQCKLDGVEKSNGAVGFIAKIQIDASLMCCSLHCSETRMHRSFYHGIYNEMSGKQNGLFVLYNLLFIILYFDRESDFGLKKEVKEYSTLYALFDSYISNWYMLVFGC